MNNSNILKNLKNRNPVRDLLAHKYLDPEMVDVDFYPIALEEGTYLTFEGFKKANDHAIETGKNRALWEHVIEAQGRDLKFPIEGAFVHNNREIRMVVLFVDPKIGVIVSGTIDVDFEVYEEVKCESLKFEKAA